MFDETRPVLSVKPQAWLRSSLYLAKHIRWPSIIDATKRDHFDLPVGPVFFKTVCDQTNIIHSHKKGETRWWMKIGHDI